MSTDQPQATAVQEGLDALFVAAIAALVIALVVPSLRNNALLFSSPFVIGGGVAVIAAVVHRR